MNKLRMIEAFLYPAATHPNREEPTEHRLQLTSALGYDQVLAARRARSHEVITEAKKANVKKDKDSLSQFLGTYIDKIYPNTKADDKWLITEELLQQIAETNSPYRTYANSLLNTTYSEENLKRKKYYIQNNKVTKVSDHSSNPRIKYYRYMGKIYKVTTKKANAEFPKNIGSRLKNLITILTPKNIKRNTKITTKITWIDVSPTGYDNEYDASILLSYSYNKNVSGRFHCHLHKQYNQLNPKPGNGWVVFTDGITIELNREDWKPWALAAWGDEFQISKYDKSANVIDAIAKRIQKRPGKHKVEKALGLNQYKISNLDFDGIPIYLKYTKTGKVKTLMVGNMSIFDVNIKGTSKNTISKIRSALDKLATYKKFGNEIITATLKELADMIDSKTNNETKVELHPKYSSTINIIVTENKSGRSNIITRPLSISQQTGKPLQLWYGNDSIILTEDASIKLENTLKLIAGYEDLVNRLQNPK